MEKILRSYNQAITYLQAERYEEAALILEPIVKENPAFTEASWALGIHHVLAGFPHKALQLWKSKQTSENENLLSYKRTVEEKLPQYDDLYEKYNQALELVQAENFDQAKEIFRELLSVQTEIPLPVDFYHGYILAQIVTGYVEHLPQEINNFPLYVRNSSVIRELQKTLEEKMIVEELTNIQKITIVQEAARKGWSKTLIICSGMAASLLIGAFGMWAINPTKEEKQR
jgi:tetratricopeptide (TPR) repeat protein